VIALHPDHDQVLLTGGSERYSLPSFLAVEHATGATRHINRAMSELFGVAAIVLRHVGDLPRGDGHVDRFYSADVLPPVDSSDSDHRWIAVAELDTWSDMPPVHLQQIRTCVSDLRHPELPSPRRLPWTQPGWYSAACRWISEQAEGIVAGTVEQITCWEQSCVLRVSTQDGLLFFKALPEMYAVEIPAVEMLASRFASNIPATVAVSIEKRWLLMRDFGGRPLMDCRDSASWHSAIHVYASMQRSMELHVDQMEAVGIPARPLGDLSQHLTNLLADEAALLSGQEGGLSPEERDELRVALPGIETHVQRIERLGIADTLEHGDLHAHNINVGDDGLVFYDWTLTAVTHPFLSMAYLEQFLEGKNSALPVSLESLREAYVKHWSTIAEVPDLRQGLRSAMVLLPLYWALTYHQFIMPFLEPRDRWLREKGVPFHLRQFLRHKLRAD
jgi:hypothetical protein